MCATQALLTYKFRLYPTKTQGLIFEETIETCRRLYNLLLADRIENGGDFYSQRGQLVSLKKENKHLRAVHSQVLQDVVLRLDKAFERYTIGMAKFPKFKRAGRCNSFTYPQRGKSFNLVGGFLKLGRIGRVKVNLHRPIVGKVKTATIIRDIDQWYVAFSVDVLPTKRGSIPQIGRSIGVDLGVSNIIALSNGTTIQGPRFLKRAELQIRSAHRGFSRTQTGSKRRFKARTRLAKALRRVRRQRDDFMHKLSNELSKQYSLIAFEDFPVTKLTHNHTFASAIMDSAWGKLRRMTAYKAERRGGRVVFVSSSGTSQKCSRCGNIVQKELATRTHVCNQCGLTLDRDVNAARNILTRGLEQARVETKPLLFHRRRISKFSRGSEKFPTDVGDSSPEERSETL